MTEEKESEIITKTFGEFKETDWRGLAVLAAIVGANSIIIVGILYAKESQHLPTIVQGAVTLAITALALYKRDRSGGSA